MAILNKEDPWGMRLTENIHQTYAVQDKSADWYTCNIIEGEKVLDFNVVHSKGQFRTALHAIGKFNVSNALAAMAAASHIGVMDAQISLGLNTFGGVVGRMQVLQFFPSRVVVDFAHTPDSLRVTLDALRQTTANKLIVVIGSAGGNRYPGKRAPLGMIATRHADLAVFTEEDSRNTPVEEILHAMERGTEGQKNYILIPDRLDAIRYSIELLEKGDTLVICGKAGETTLHRSSEIIPWNETEIVRSELSDLASRI